MQTEDEITIEAEQEQLWALISDPEVLVNCVPGAKEVTQESETEYTGVIERSLAGVTLSLNGEVDMIEREPPTYVKVDAVGEDSRTNSRMDATAEMTIAESGDGASELSYVIDMEFTGRLATLGSRLVKRKIRSDIDEFFENVRDELENGEAASDG
ncbi:CoxG family protein [Natrarchaeobius chitinivorans]|uniref:Carbon monoxide dehydrogenase n=1 Tax=Natrarchaeobius chitinivorans TaxID=1679083 RepID=A0A3N6ME08_NATCH|nr:SRPBCC domain-containing protein [Natrarchaeobius chitinivorans]RQG94860.1 hypothetical protein EA473_10200 [Natrarchaeobius chitinivorans]